MSFVVEKDIPKELSESVQNFNAAISQIELILQSLLLTSRTDVVEKAMFCLFIKFVFIL